MANIFQKAWSRWFHAFFLCAFAFAQVTFAWSEETGISQETRDMAVQIAKQIETQNLVITKPDGDVLPEIKDHDPRKAFFELRRAAIRYISVENSLDKDEILKVYHRMLETNGTQRDRRIGQLLGDVFAYFEPANVQANYPELMDILEPYTQQSDWMTAYMAFYIQSKLASYNLETTQALEYAQEAMDVIPQGDIEFKNQLYTRILISSHITYLYNLIRNPEMAVKNTQALIDLQLRHNDPVDGSTLLNNLVYSFTAWRDFETVGQLADVLLRLEETNISSTPGLTHMRTARIYNELGQNEKSLTTINRGLALAQHQSIKSNLLIQKVIALAGQGNLSAARLAYRDFVEMTPADIRERGSLGRRTLKAKALMAGLEGDNSSADMLYRTLINEEILSVLQSYSKDSSSLLASLQNSKERQDEREAALRREAELKQYAFEKTARLNRVLWAALIIVLLAATAFVFYRIRVSRRLRGALERARAGEKAKSDFLSVMSHELRTPLNGIMGMADYLSRTLPTEELRKKNAIILESGNELLSLVENILDMTVIENGGVRLSSIETDMRELIERVDSTWRDKIEQKGVIFTSHVSSDMPENFDTDAVRLEQIINILMSNAAKFTAKGRVHLHVSCDFAAENPPQIHIIVADTGVGITEQAQALLFEPFVQADSSMTRRYGGAGLGLTIAQNLAMLMGGSISVNSKPGRGSEFRFTLPIVESHDLPADDPLTAPVVRDNLEPAKLTSRRADKPSEKGHVDEIYKAYAKQGLDRLRVLLIEDNIASQRVLTTILAPLGCSVTCFDDAQSGLNALGVSPFDVVLMDIRMPGMDGVMAAKHIRNSQQPYANIPIIAVTADVAPETYVRCKTAGVNRFLKKPINPEILFEVLAEIVKVRHPEVRTRHVDTKTG